MVRIQLALGQLEHWPSASIPGFVDRIVALLPGLQNHGCCFRKPGGFIRRLREGTWLGHVVEHVALELQTMAGHRVTRGKTRSVKGQPGIYNVMFAYRDEEVGRLAGRVAVELVHALLPPGLDGVEGLERIATIEGAYDFEERLAALGQMVRRRSFGPSTQALVDAARRRGIPVMRLNDRSLVQLGYGKWQQRLRASITGRSSLIAVELAGDKYLTKTMLAEGGVPVPKGALVRSVAQATEAARALGYPLVVKPLDGNHGRGVTTGITDEAQLADGVAAALQHGRNVIVEQHFQGKDHRILVVGGEFVACAERVPAHVIGDGCSTIAQLVDETNRDPRRGEGHEKVMTRIALDAGAASHLARQALSFDSVPAAGQRVVLTATANLSTGGSAIDRTDEIHPHNAELARRAAAITGLDVAGIDFIAPDFRRSVLETGGGVIEVNAAPGLRMHLEPSEGQARDVASPIIDMLFPRGSPSRIPIIAITGTNGKSTTARMVKHVLRTQGMSVGLTSTSGVYVDDLQVASGDATGPRSARMVLRDPTVEVAVLETARGGMLREGLAFDRADVGAFLNVSADHLGLKGIDTLAQLADLKSLVVETVDRRGTSVLNADDPLVAGVSRRAGGRIAWFSMQGGPQMPDFVREHVERGGLAVVREQGPGGGMIVVHDRGKRRPLMHASEIPATLDGMAAFNIANALAVTAICVAQGLPMETIRAGLATFHSNYEQNPGRLNVKDMHGFRTIVDYAHNPAGLKAIGELVQRMRPSYRRAIGTISIPGDRRDEDILEMGRIAAGIFDEVFFREDPSTRGRPRGQIMNLLYDGARRAGMAAEQIHLIAGEGEATRASLEACMPGDLLVITPSEVAVAWQQVCDFARTGHRQLLAAE